MPQPIQTDRLSGRVAVVTGGGRGIGRAIALAFAAEGADLCLVARTREQLDAVAHEVRALGRTAVPIVADVTVPDDCSRIADAVRDRFGRLDILVNNAGGSIEPAPVLESDPGRWVQDVQANLISVYLVTRHLLPLMVETGGGKIINTGSGMGHGAGAGNSAYRVGKSGQWMLTRCLAAEVWEHGIDVNELVPGPVQTDLTKSRMQVGAPPPFAPSERVKYPEDVAPLAVWLATQPAGGPRHSRSAWPGGRSEMREASTMKGMKNMKGTRKTKIVCTIGPASESPEVLEQLIDAGMDVARLNFSHGTHEEHAAKIRNIRFLGRKAERPIAILQDLAGPKIRVGAFGDGPVRLTSGDRFVLTTRQITGDASAVSVTYDGLPRDVAEGDTLLLADGALELTVEDVDDTDITCKVVTGGELGSHKGINLPSRSIQAPILSDKDRADIRFGVAHGVDYIAVSFVRSADDIGTVKAFLKEVGADVPLIAKIEKHEAVTGIDAIVRAVDGLMVARGDLGVEIPMEQVPRVQKTVIDKANRAGKPVITATQMLRSMVDAPRPTRAEVTDVANAILDGTDAVMLSEETAVGRYPVEAVGTMHRIALETDPAVPGRAWLQARRQDAGAASPDEAVAAAACRMADSIRAAAILTCTQSGWTARLVAKHRPPQPILAATPDARTLVRLSLVWGCTPLLIRAINDFSEMEMASLEAARATGVVSAGDTVVLTAGIPLHVAGTTNLIKVETIGRDPS